MDHLLTVRKQSTLGKIVPWLLASKLDVSVLASKHKTPIGEVLESQPEVSKDDAQNLNS